MSDAGPSSQGSPFWRFSLQFYRLPKVADACIALQEEAGVDVNLLLFLLWHARQRRRLSTADVAALEAKIAPWRDATVIPLRGVRRALEVAAGAGRSRRPPKRSATASRRWSSKPSGCSRRRCTRWRRWAPKPATRTQAAAGNVGAYAGDARGTVPAGAAETLLAAFAAMPAE